MKAQGRNRGEMGVRWRRGPTEATGSGSRQKKETSKPASEEVGDFQKRDRSLEERAAALSIHPDFKEWPLPDLEGRK